MEQPNKEICTIRIMFPVDSDEQAIDCKKKIKEALSEVPDVTTQFSLMDIPATVPSPIPKNGR